MADIAEQLKDALTRTVKGGRTLYAVAKAAGLKPEMLYGFTRGDRDLRLESAAKLAAVLGLTLTEIDPKPEPKKTTRPKRK